MTVPTALWITGVFLRYPNPTARTTYFVFQQWGALVDPRRYERLTLEATTVGHDLTRGTATFFRAVTENITEDREHSLQEVVGKVEAEQHGTGLPVEELESLGDPAEEEPEERSDEDGVVTRDA